MSRESSAWLNQNVLVGFTEKRGNAWHYRKSDQGVEPNHYVGPVPLADVERRLFHWSAAERPLLVPNGAGENIVIPDRKAIVRDDTDAVLGIFKNGYQPHQYREWLLNNVATILDGDLSIGSAGLLKGGGVAWVQVEVPESVGTPEGVTFRPNLLAGTSFDGSLSTTYKRTVTFVVCDNTCAYALNEDGQQFKVKHSAKSLDRLTDAREALYIVEQTAEEFAETISALASFEVSTREWNALLDAVLPVTEGSARSATIVGNKKDALNTLYNSDSRVTPWKGTAFGALQAFNTFGQHVATVKGAERPERNALNALIGATEKADANVIDTLVKVTGRQLVGAN